MVGLDGLLYVIGGECSTTMYRSVEVYQASENKWESVPDMQYCRSGAGSSALGGKVYVAGGHDKSSAHSSMECYDPMERAWTMCADMAYACSGVALVGTSTHLYSFGGRSKSNQVYYNKIQRYTPFTDSWEQISTMIQPRAWPSAVLFNGAIFIVGGFDGRDRLNTVERFDVRTGFRSPMDSMNESRAGCGAAIV